MKKLMIAVAMIMGLTANAAQASFKQNLLDAANDALANAAVLAAAESAATYFTNDVTISNKHVESDVAGTYADATGYSNNWVYTWNSKTGLGSWQKATQNVDFDKYVLLRAEMESQSHMWKIHVSYDWSIGKYKIAGYGADGVLRTVAYGADFYAVANDIYEEGYKDGYEDGYTDGFRDGFAVGCSYGSNSC